MADMNKWQSLYDEQVILGLSFRPVYVVGQLWNYWLPFVKLYMFTIEMHYLQFVMNNQEYLRTRVRLHAQLGSCANHTLSVWRPLRLLESESL